MHDLGESINANMPHRPCVYLRLKRYSNGSIDYERTVKNMDGTIEYNARYDWRTSDADQAAENGTIDSMIEQIAEDLYESLRCPCTYISLKRQTNGSVEYERKVKYRDGEVSYNILTIGIQ